MKSVNVLGICGFSIATAIVTIAGCRSKNVDTSVDASVPETPEAIARGEYLVKAVAGCGECHTPRDAQGNLDTTKWLAGVANRFDLVPEDDLRGGISAPNLTPYALKTWSDSQLREAIVNGRSANGEVLYPLMPYYAFHNMKDDDVNAIIAYLRGVPAQQVDIPPRQPLPAVPETPAQAVPESAIPHTTLKASDPLFGHAENGRYLAAEVGFCMDCHTPWSAGLPQPLDLAKMFTGGRPFSARDWAVPAPAPAILYSYNVTPDQSGIKDWTPQMVAAALKLGTDDQGAALCRPMPSFAALTDTDAIDIGIYLTTLPPIASAAVPQCEAGGAADAGADAQADAGADADARADAAAGADAGADADATTGADADAGADAAAGADADAAAGADAN